jgi:hypothetical protein
MRQSGSEAWPAPRHDQLIYCFPIQFAEYNLELWVSGGNTATEKEKDKCDA